MPVGASEALLDICFSSQLTQVFAKSVLGTGQLLAASPVISGSYRETGEGFHFISGDTDRENTRQNQGGNSAGTMPATQV